MIAATNPSLPLLLLEPNRFQSGQPLNRMTNCAIGSARSEATATAAGVGVPFCPLLDGCRSWPRAPWSGTCPRARAPWPSPGSPSGCPGRAGSASRLSAGRSPVGPRHPCLPSVAAYGLLYG
eukprot:scaffold247264_cov41-Prasinocladus_malaysianus.AAC.2